MSVSAELHAYIVAQETDGSGQHTLLPYGPDVPTATNEVSTWLESGSYFTALDRDNPDIHEDTRKDILTFDGKVGLRYSANNYMLLNTIQAFRRARGRIVATHIDDPVMRLADGIQDLAPDENLTSGQELELFRHVAELAIVAGGLYWDSSLSEKLQRQQEVGPEVGRLLQVHKQLERASAPIRDPEPYQHYSNSLVRSALRYVGQWHHSVGTISERVAQLGDDLGNHFDDHNYLAGISIQSLQEFTGRSSSHLVALAANLSSGIMEAGIVAHYLNEYLGIPTVVDPVIFNKLPSSSIEILATEAQKLTDEEIFAQIRNGKHFTLAGLYDKAHEIELPRELRVMKCYISSDMFGRAKNEVIVIPFDDDIVGTGTSLRAACEAARIKYGEERILPGRRPRLYSGVNMKVQEVY